MARNSSCIYSSRHSQGPAALQLRFQITASLPAAGVGQVGADWSPLHGRVE